MRALVIFGLVAFVAALYSSPLVPWVVSLGLGIRSAGDWKIACPPGQGACQAWLELQEGVSRSTHVSGTFGSLELRVTATPSGERYFMATFDDHRIPTWEGVKLDRIRVDEEDFRLFCRHRVCTTSGRRAPELIGALRHGRTAVLQPRDREPVEIDIRDFASAWDILEEKLAKGEASMDLPEWAVRE